MEDKLKEMLAWIEDAMACAKNSRNLLQEAIERGDRYEIKNRLFELQHDLEDADRYTREMEEKLNED